MISQKISWLDLGDLHAITAEGAQRLLTAASKVCEPSNLFLPTEITEMHEMDPI